EHTIDDLHPLADRVLYCGILERLDAECLRRHVERRDERTSERLEHGLTLNRRLSVVHETAPWSRRSAFSTALRTIRCGSAAACARAVLAAGALIFPRASAAHAVTAGDGRENSFVPLSRPSSMSMLSAVATA